MVVHHGSSRKDQGPRAPLKGTPAVPTIRVAVRVEPVKAPAKAAVPSAPGTSAQAAPAVPAPGLPCSGRCGHCDCHPCRLHASV